MKRANPNIAARAGELFESGLNCAESILLAYVESNGDVCPAVPRLATGFCAGMSRTCGLCGALSGGVLVIGLELGRNSAEDSNEDCYAAVRRFKRSFEERFHSDNCRELTGCDFSTPGGVEEFYARNLKPQCRHYVEVAADLAIEAARSHGGSKRST